MPEWTATTHSLIPQGEIAEVLLIYRQGSTPGTIDMMRMSGESMSLTGSFSTDDHSFIKGAAYPSGQSREINGFLQCILDLAWKRGLRPAGFEGPQELAATKRHLEDMRTLALGKASDVSRET